MKHTYILVIEYDGTNIHLVSSCIKQYGIESQSTIVVEDGSQYLMYATPYDKADEEHPQIGDVYTIHPDKSCIVYTAGEFEAKFKPVTP